jgi:hypothetical protein
MEAAIEEGCERIDPDQWTEVKSANFDIEDDDPLLPGAKLPDVLRGLESISLHDLKEMEAAIEEACERIDPDQWS